MGEAMSVLEFKQGMMKLARSEPMCGASVAAAWRLVFAYLNADGEAQRDCSAMLRADLQELTHGVR